MTPRSITIEPARIAQHGTLARALLLALLSLAAIPGVADPASAQSANPYEFKKEAFKPDGTPWTGPVHVGDVIKYVLSYKPGTTNSGPVTIDDTLSPNLKYLPPTKVSDAGWSWGSSPYSIGNHEQYKHPGFGPNTGSVKVTVTGQPAPTSGTGDGTIPIPIAGLQKVFGVFHHAANAAEGKIDCWDLNSLAKCGTAQPNATSGFLHTPYTPHSVVRGTTIYFLGYRANGTVSIGCFNAAAQTACADIPITPPGAVADRGELTGLVEDNTGRVFAAIKGKVYCRTLPAGTNCAGWPAGGLPSITGTTSPSYLSGNVLYAAMEYGPSPTRIYIHHGDAVLQCIDTNLPAPCAGWPAAGKKLPPPATNLGIMLSSFPLSGSSGDGGVCLWEKVGGVQAGCLSHSGAVVAVTPTSIAAPSLSSFRLANSGKVFFATHGSGGPKCFDYSGTTGTACAGFTSPTPPPNGLQYGFALDPRDPAKCMLTLGDKNVMWRFDYHTGKIAGCGTPPVTTPEIKDIYCNGEPTLSTFRWATIRALTPGAGGALTIAKGTGAPFPLTISGTGSYLIPAGIGPGYGQLSITYAPNSGSPLTVEFEIGFTSDKNPQICYQAEVKACGPVFNTAVFKGKFSGAAVNVSQKVDLGNATGPDCPELTECLKDSKVTVKCNSDGTFTVTLNTSGFTGTDITMTSQTPGVTVAPPQQPWAATTTWTLTGATPGQAVTLFANETRVGSGSVAGSDLCCSGEIKLVMPECKKPDDLKIDLAVVKTGGTSPVPQVNGYAFHLAVTSVGTPFNGTNVVTVSDVVPAGMTFNSAAGTNWTCATLPASAGTTITCTYTGAGPTAVNQPLGTIDIVATATGSAPFPPFRNCAIVGLKPGSGSTDTNALNNESCVTVTKPDVGCPPPLVAGAVPGQCLCPSGTALIGRECVKQTTCQPPMVPGPVTGQCICPPPTHLVGNKCEGPPPPPPACRPPMVPGPLAGQCICPQGTVQKGRECVRPIVCRPPLIPNPTGSDCVCPQGTTQRGKECIKQPVCNPPAKLNRRGACECPRDMVAKGSSCIERERPRPPISPGDIIRPRDGRDNPRDGRDTGSPRGGGQGPTDGKR